MSSAPGRRRVIVLLTLLAACGGGSTEPSLSLTGNWHGGNSAQGVTIQMSFALTDNSGALAGNGSLSGNGVPTCSPGLVGNRQRRVVNLTITCTGYVPLGFQGEVDGTGNIISGTIGGSGFNPFGFDFTRQ